MDDGIELLRMPDAAAAIPPPLPIFLFHSVATRSVSGSLGSRCTSQRDTCPLGNGVLTDVEVAAGVSGVTCTIIRLVVPAGMSGLDGSQIRAV